MATGCRSIALGLASMLAVSCQTTRDLTTPGSGMTARVVASDASRPVGPDGRPVSVTGTATFTGLTVELWDGQQWLAVANGSGTATFALEDGTAAATLVPASELPAGDYTQIRLTATDAVIDLTTGDGSQQFSAQLQSNGPVVITKSVTVTVNPDGSRTIAVQLQLVRTVATQVDSTTGARSVTVSGDMGTSTASMH